MVAGGPSVTARHHDDLAADAGPELLERLRVSPSGNRSLIITSGSSTPAANSSPARSKLCSTAIDPVMVISWL